MLSRIASIRERSSHWLFQTDETTLTGSRRRWLRIARFFTLLLQVIREDRVAHRASSLTYTTLLSIFPLLAVITSLAAVFTGGAKDLETQIVTYIEQQIMPASSASLPTFEEEQKAAQRREAVENLQHTIRSMFQSFRENAGRIGFLGFIGVLITAGLLYSTIEGAFNEMWKVHEKSSALRTLTTFTTLIVASPILIGASVTVTAALGKFAASGTMQIPLVSWLAGSLIPPILNGVTIALAYMLIPRARVNARAAFIGGLIAGFTWELAKIAFGYYVFSSTARTALYRSLGAVPILLIWIYFTWLVFLVGNEIVYIVQNYRSLRRERFSRPNYTVYDGKLLFAVMFLIADGFDRDRGGESYARLKDFLGLRDEELQSCLDRLMKAGLITRTQTGFFAPSRPLEHISPSEALALGCSLPNLFHSPELGQHRAQLILKDLQESEENWKKGKSLKDLLQSLPPDSSLLEAPGR